MRSIGVFWKEHEGKDKNRDCYPCPYQIDDQIPLESLKGRKTSNRDRFTLQINLWNTKVSDRNNAKSHSFFAIDFGLVCPLSTSEIALLLPFEVKKEDFCDLAEILAEDTNLLCTVFNEDVKSTSEPEKSYHLIESEKFKYVMYELSSDNITKCDFDDESNTTILVIRMNSNFDQPEYSGTKLFLRFRILMKGLDSFGQKKKVSNDWLQSAFSSTYMFDIRINDVREMSKKKKEYIEYNGFKLPVFNKIHFFYMSDSEETVENGSKLNCDSRLLENDRWHNYLGKGIEFVSTNVAHHWKKEVKKSLSIANDPKVERNSGAIPFVLEYPVIDNFSLFFKTEFSDQNWKRIIIYIFIIVLLGAIGSTIVSLLSLTVKDWWTCAVAVLAEISVLYSCLACQHFHN